MTTNGATLSAPLGLLAELTHRCPLGCPYCSNPLALDKRDDELDAATWERVFREAAGLGVLQVHLSGGEPVARRDLPEIVRAAREAGLYNNLITSAVGLTPSNLATLSDAGLDHVQISIQDSEEGSADHIAGYKGASARKRAIAREVVSLGLPLTVNMVVHRANIGRIESMVELALSLGASRVEIAHVQYYGWALKNRAALMPTREQVDEAVRQVEMLRARHHGQIVIDAVVPITMRVFPSPASAVGDAARSTSPPRAGCFPVMRLKSFPVSNSGMCASIRLPTSGGARRRFWHSVALIGCRSRASPAPGAIKILAGAVARPSYLRATRAPPIRFATCHRIMPWSRNWRRIARMLPTRTVRPDFAKFSTSRLQRRVER